MGRKNKEYKKDLKEQAYDKFKSMEAYGESKKQAMLDGTAKAKIFSYSTMKTYRKHVADFCDWVKKEHPKATTLKAAKKYVNEWLHYRSTCVNIKGEPLSAWTIQTEAKALGKLYGINKGDPDYFTPPERKRQNIKRSRSSSVARDDHFSEQKNAEFVTFCKATGLRRSEVSKLTGKDLCTKKAIEKRISDLQSRHDITESDNKQLTMLMDTRLYPDAQFYVYVKRGKGGRQRLVPLCVDQESTNVVVNKMRNTAADAIVWKKVPTNADIHSYRADYATAVYKKYARRIEDIPYDAINRGTGHKYQSQIYVCRKDCYKKLDRQAMLRASKALGHNRLNVIADNYLWKL